MWGGTAARGKKMQRWINREKVGTTARWPEWSRTGGKRFEENTWISTVRVNAHITVFHFLVWIMSPDPGKEVEPGLRVIWQVAEQVSQIHTRANVSVGGELWHSWICYSKQIHWWRVTNSHQCSLLHACNKVLFLVWTLGLLAFHQPANLFSLLQPTPFDLKLNTLAPRPI